MSLLPVVLVAAGGDDCSSIYFAPENRVSFKTVAAGDDVRRFNEGVPGRDDQMRSADGWIATFGENGRVTVESPDNREGKAVWEFDRGRIVSRLSGGETAVFPYDTPRSAPEGVLTPLAFFEFTDEYLKEKEEHALDGKWDGSGRLAFPYGNPNYSGALFCHLLLVSLAALMVFQGKARVASAVVAAAFFVCLMLTGSRGSLLGFAVGILPIVAFRLRAILRSRVFWMLSAIVAVAVFVWFGVLHTDHLTRGFSGGGMDWGNAIRLDMLRAAPRLMFDAPGGWGFVGAGRAYFDWYQPLYSMYMTGSLMNDHLTILANAGWVGRFAYMFVVLLLLSLSFLLAKRKGMVLPASLLVATVVMSCFNPLSGCLTLWTIPVLAALVVAVRAFGVRARLLAVIAGVSALASAALVLAIFFIGSSLSHADGLRIAATGRQVRVNGTNPAIWIVDDTQGALGGIFAAKDIREFYGYVPYAPGVGYVRSIADLPAEGISRLVLSGKSANDWLLRLSEDPEARKHLPKDVVFVTPPFAPSEIPDALFHFCKVRVLVGEFAARFQPEYASPPLFVEIVPGMERYILRWMEYVTGP